MWHTTLTHVSYLLLGDGCSTITSPVCSSIRWLRLTSLSRSERSLPGQWTFSKTICWAGFRNTEVGYVIHQYIFTVFFPETPCLRLYTGVDKVLHIRFCFLFVSIQWVVALRDPVDASMKIWSCQLMFVCIYSGLQKYFILRSCIYAFYFSVCL